MKKEETSPLCQQCTGFKKCLAETSGKFNKAFSWAQIGVQKCYDTKKERRNKIEGKIGKILFDFIVDREKIDDNDTSSLLRVANECTQLRNRIVSELDFYIDK